MTFVAKRYLRPRLALEVLESRQLLNGDSAFLGLGSLSASYAPDDTQVGFRINELHREFDARFGNGQWQPVIEKAFQRWVREAEINIGFVDDNGAPAGVYGPSRGDERFGDIRIYGLPLGDQVWAEAVSENAGSAGTWAGDIIFNTDASWRSLEDLERVAVHEVGHILGLPHSDDPLSPMHQHSPNTALHPTVNDIALVQALHGARQDDPNEGRDGNNQIDDASRIKGNEEDEDSTNDDFDGSQVWVQFGDLLGQEDIDVFEIHTADGYSGPIDFRVSSEGLSQSRLRAELLDDNGQMLAMAEVGGLSGAQDLQIAESQPGEKYYLRLMPTEDPFWTQGDYSVVVGTPTDLESRTEIQEYSQLVHRWYYNSRGAKRGFSFHLKDQGLDGYQDDDGHLDDDASNAIRLEPVLVTGQTARYATVGTIVDQIDIDNFRLTLPATVAQNSSMLIDLQSLERDTLVPEIAVFDKQGNRLSHELLSVGLGTTRLVVHGVQPEAEYVLQLDASVIDPIHRIGNFSLNIEVREAISPDHEYIAQTLSENSEIAEVLYVAIPQLFTFSLESQTSQSNSGNSQAQFRIFDANKKLLHVLVAPFNTMRSLPGVLLDAGEYYLQVSSVLDGVSATEVSVKLTGTQPSQPIGPLVAPVDSTPLYECPIPNGEFCFPDGTQSPIPSHDVPTSLPLPAPPVEPIPLPPDEFFWQLIIPTNPDNPLDASGDSFVSPLDALIVINYINTVGSGRYPESFVGFLDVNADGFVSPIDVLSIVNQLNQSP